MQVVVWLTDLESKTYLAATSRRAQRFLAAALSPMAKLLDYRAFHPKHSAVH